MTSAKAPAFDRFASAVADFGSPFYTEERQRDVWNQACAFGFQLFVWASLILGALMLWIGGRPLLPYALALLLVAAIASGLVVVCARRLGLDVPFGGALTGGRLLVYLVLYAATVLGAARAVAPGFSLAGYGSAVVIGAAGVAGLLAGQWWRRRGRRERGEAAHGVRPGL